MRRAYRHFIVVLGLMVGIPGFGDNRAPSPSPSSQMKEVRKRVAEADAAYWEARRKVPEGQEGGPEIDRLWEEAIHAKREGVKAALEIARAEPQSDAGFEALEWLLLQAPGVYSDAVAGEAALELMARHHAANPKVGKAVARVANFPPYGLPHGDVKAEAAYKPAMELLSAVAKTNPDRAVRGQAALGLAWQAKRAFQYAAYKRSPAADRYKAEAERALEQVVAHYGDCPWLGMNNKGLPSSKTLAILARADLFELRRLQPGNEAPEIAAEDLGGTAYKLSDYRGKVVLLVFWGSWCGPCMAAVPHERQLVERFKARPFVVIGVNSDEDRGKAQRAAAREKIPWRSFWNGSEGPGGPIAAAWNVHEWPTVYVIDARGVIRHNNLDGEDLDAPLEKLVAEAEARKAE